MQHLGGLERLGDDEPHAVPRELGGVEAVAPARDEPDRDVREPGVARFGHLPAGHARHRHVAEDDVDRLRLGEREPRRAVRRVDDRVALAAQELAEHRPHAGLVVDHEDARGPAGRAGAEPAGGSGADRATGSRTVNVLPSPGRLATSTVPPCRVTMPQTTAEPEPAALGSLRREEGLEDPLRGLG